MSDTERMDWLEKVLADEIYYHDVMLQSDAEDGVWVSLRDKGMHGTLVTDGQEERAETLREVLDNAMAKALWGGGEVKRPESGMKITAEDILLILRIMEPLQSDDDPQFADLRKRLTIRATRASAREVR